MANPTTNFGWVMPTSTSLVTNLPADFNTFGQGVDTSMAQLKGGTTGQVLSKTSGTDMAFTWVTPTDQTPLTTKGDLFTFTTVDARLGVGTNGQILTADSTAATGLKWATAASGSTFSGCVLTNSAVQSIANATVQVITFDTESLDTDGFHSTSTNTGRITIPTGKAGKYLFTAMGQFPNNGTGSREIAMYVNGTQKTASTGVPSGSTTTSITLTFTLDLAVSDYVDLRAYQSSGGALNLNGNATSTGVSNFCCTYLGA